MEKRVRVRFAPSPTGPLHIGGVRTALYNYLFAKKNGGDFLLRIEDTDQTRYVEGAESYILESLKWCGIQVDEGVSVGGSHAPYRQSERKAIYKKYADQLVESNNAYYAFDSSEELQIMKQQLEEEKAVITSYSHLNRDKMNNSLCLSAEEVQKKMDNGDAYVVRFKMPEEHEVVFTDMVRGEVKFNTSCLDDKVIFKSDGLPTYHLANIVDDHLMEISHVIRGEEWLPSTPLHVLLYECLNWEKPKFAHLPLLLKPTGKGKLSKRDGDKGGFPVFPLEWHAPDGTICSGYREAGYFNDAFINLLALLGWNTGTEQEILSMEDLIQQFSIDRVGKSGARFDPEKAKWFNHQYMQQKSDEELALMFDAILLKKDIIADRQKLIKIVSLVKERSNFIHELWEQSSYFFEAPIEFDTKAVKKRWKEDSPILMSELSGILELTDNYSSENLEELIKGWIEVRELNMGAVMNAFRLSIVGALKGAHLFDIIEIIGKEETVKRLDFAVQNIKK